MMRRTALTGLIVAAMLAACSRHSATVSFAAPNGWTPLSNSAAATLMSLAGTQVFFSPRRHGELIAFSKVPFASHLDPKDFAHSQTDVPQEMQVRQISICDGRAATDVTMTGSVKTNYDFGQGGVVKDTKQFVEIVIVQYPQGAFAATYMRPLSVPADSQAVDAIHHLCLNKTTS